MALLPPVGWADVTTKEDLRSLAVSILGQIHQEIISLSKTVVVAIVGAIAAVGGLAFATAGLV